MWSVAIVAFALAIALAAWVYVTYFRPDQKIVAKPRPPSPARTAPTHAVMPDSLGTPGATSVPGQSSEAAGKRNGPQTHSRSRTSKHSAAPAETPFGASRPDDQAKTSDHSRALTVGIDARTTVSIPGMMVTARSSISIKVDNMECPITGPAIDLTTCPTKVSPGSQITLRIREGAELQSVTSTVDSLESARVAHERIQPR